MIDKRDYLSSNTKQTLTDIYQKSYRSVSSSGSVEWSHAAATYASPTVFIFEKYNDIDIGIIMIMMMMILNEHDLQYYINNIYDDENDE